jgi:tetratricopeptide (TPR) repeat protein
LSLRSRPSEKTEGERGASEIGADAVRRGDFRAALVAYRRARESAVDTVGRDRADLNIAMVLLQMGDSRGGEEGLRGILLRAADDRVAFHAAYNLASSLRGQARYEKALAYARRAMERARAIGGDPDLVAPVHNLLGNVFLAQNYLDEALVEYETAMALRRSQEGDTRFSRAILDENIGYCMILKRRFPEGVARVRTAYALAEEIGDERCKAECLQDLCYAHLLEGRHDEAIEDGVAALEAAARAPFPDISENCHYLLGEIGTRTGRADLRDRHFEELQRLHPEVSFLQEFLCTVDVTDFITLKR